MDNLSISKRRLIPIILIFGSCIFYMIRVGFSWMPVLVMLIYAIILVDDLKIFKVEFSRYRPGYYFSNKIVSIAYLNQNKVYYITFDLIIFKRQIVAYESIRKPMIRHLGLLAVPGILIMVLHGVLVGLVIVALIPGHVCLYLSRILNMIGWVLVGDLRTAKIVWKHLHNKF